ncbi:hypothetical protein [Microseira sp. BLCC-F43]|uniref:hypothetical protein n=1 Tax=Microseira sp. BLCC-F43 TaxID=3153602 RepID=UPI0035BA0494
MLQFFTIRAAIGHGRSIWKRQRICFPSPFCTWFKTLRLTVKLLNLPGIPAGWHCDAAGGRGLGVLVGALVRGYGFYLKDK